MILKNNEVCQAADMLLGGGVGESEPHDCNSLKRKRNARD